MNKSVLLHLWDAIGIPFRLVLFDQEWLKSFRWTTLEEERVNAVLPFVRGDLLDVGAGKNSLVARYGKGVGVDIHPTGPNIIKVEDSSQLPFADGSFDTISFLASLNHIPNRAQALEEANRLLRPNGTLLITMIGPLLGRIGHKIWWYDEHRKRGGMHPGERPGLTRNEINELCDKAGFAFVRRRRFLYWLNNLLVFSK